MKTLNNGIISAKDGLTRPRFRQRDRDDDPGGAIEHPHRIIPNWRTILKSAHVFSLSVLLTVVSGFATPTFAADIEIYSDTLDTSGTLKPNILFMLDNSDSMKLVPGKDISPNHDDNTEGYESRLYYLREAMVETIEAVSDIANVGIGRFTRVDVDDVSSNAPIIFPIIPDPDAEILQQISVPIRQSLDDAMEIVAADVSRNGTMNVNSSTLLVVSIITVTVGSSTYEISLDSRSGQTWKYRVKKLTSGSGENFSWALDTACDVSIGSDIDSGFSNGTFEFTLDNKYPGTSVEVQINGNVVSEIVGPDCGMTTGGTDNETVPVFDPYTTIIEDDGSRFKVSFKGMDENANGTTTWTYKAEEVDTTGGSLAHWRLMGDDSKTTTGTEWWQCHLFDDADLFDDDDSTGTVYTGSSQKMQGIGWSSTGEVSFTLPRKFPVGYIYAFAGVTDPITDPITDLKPPANPILGPLCNDRVVKTVKTCAGESCDYVNYEISLTSFNNNTWTYHVNLETASDKKILEDWRLILPELCVDELGSTSPPHDKILAGQKIKWLVPDNFAGDDFSVTLNGETLDDDDLSGNHIAGKVGGDFVPTDLKNDKNKFDIVGPAICEKPLEHEPSSCVNDDAGTMTICHRPYGNPDKAHTIEIPKSEWPAHLKGGDTVGKCFKDIVADTLNHKGEREIDQAKCENIAEEVSNNNGADKITICHNVRADKSSSPEPSLPCNGAALSKHLDHPNEENPAHKNDTIAVCCDVDGDGDIEKDEAQCGFDGPAVTCPDAATEKMKVGLRFEYVDIPQGATITSAKLRFNSAAKHADTDDLATFVIKVQDTDNALSFSEDNQDISERLQFGNVEWKVNHWSSTSTPETPDLSELVQHIVGDTVDGTHDWCGGQSIAFLIDGDENGTLHRVWSYDGDPDLAPRLEVEFTTTPQNEGCIKQSLFTQVNAPENDAEEKIGGSGAGDVFVNESGSETLEIGTSGGSQRMVGLRFENVPIPSGTNNIVEAHLILRAKEDSNANDGSVVNLTITGEAELNSVSFNTNKYNLSTGRSKFTPSESWSVTEPWQTGLFYRSDDITAIVQQMVNQTDWDDTENSMTFFITGESGTGTRKAFSFHTEDTEPSEAALQAAALQAATLHIKVNSRLKELTSQDSIPIIIDKRMKSNGMETPLVDALYESMMYYRGGEVTYGKDRQGHQQHLISVPASYTHQPADPDNPIEPEFERSDDCDKLFDSDPFDWTCKSEKIKVESGLTPMYNSPIEQLAGCKSNNYIVLLTDGEATYNDSLNKVTTLFTEESFDEGLNGTVNCKKAYGTFTEDSYEECGIALATFLHEKIDVVTHTVGVGLAEGSHALKYLDLMAKAGGSDNGVYTIDTSDPTTVTAQLKETFVKIVLEATKGTSSFAPAGVSVSRFNRMRHDNEVYYALFENAKTRSWLGNIKKFKFDSVDTTAESNPLCTDESPAENCKLTLVGKGGEVAVKDNYLSDKAADMWAGQDEEGNEITSDASKITAGGAGGQLMASKADSSTSRTVFTSTSTGTALVPLTTANSGLSAEIVDWIKGVKDEGTTDPNRNWLMAESLHSSPKAITYGVGDTKVVVGTNDGLLRMIDAETGTEDWAFLPPALFQIQADLMTNGNALDADPLMRQHIYGMDGTAAVWVKENSDSDTIRLFVGMRRGGHNYYGLNVTDTAAPKLMWVIKGKDGHDVSFSAGFANLGQTWSTPRPVKVHRNYCNAVYAELDNKACIALLFAGGYDPVQDELEDTDGDGTLDALTHYKQENHVGNAIYMVHAKTGRLLWMASSDATGAGNLNMAEMKYAIPSDLTVLDTDGDGTTDRIYAADIAGQVWRIELWGKRLEDYLYTDLSRGDRLAYLASNANEADKRQFFAAPAWIHTESGDVVAVTSGSRVYPKTLRQAQDRVYAIPDAGKWVYNQATGKYKLETMIVESNMEQIAAFGGETINEDGGTDGWYMNFFRSGEKGFARPVIIEKASADNPHRKVLIFTTYVPASLTTIQGPDAACAFDEGTTRLYAVDLANGAPVFDDVNDEDKAFDPDTPPGGSNDDTPGDSDDPDTDTPEDSDDNPEKDRSIEVGKGVNSDINTVYTEDEVVVNIGNNFNKIKDREAPQRVFWLQVDE